MSQPKKHVSLPIGSQIRSIRKNLGLSLKEVAVRAGTRAPTMHRYEGGYEGYSFPTLKKIAEALDADLEIRFQPRTRSRQAETTSQGKPTRKHLFDTVHRLFWDRKITVADLDEFSVWALRRILMEGNLNQVQLAVGYYGTGLVSEVIRGRGIDDKTRVFWENQLKGGT